MRIPLVRAICILSGFLAVTIAGPVLAQADDPDLDGVPGLAPPPAEPFTPVPSILAGTGNLLIDRSHGNNFNVNGFISFLASQGWIIAEHLSGPITQAVLAGSDILLVPCRFDNSSIAPFSSAEVSAIQAFIGSGRGVWILSDTVPQSGINTLSVPLGVTFRSDFIQDPTNNEGQLFWPTIHLLSPHPITVGIESYGYYAGDCLAVSAPAQVICRADEDAFSLFCPAGSFPPVLAVREETGRVVFAGDITPLHPEYYPSRLRDEEQLLLQNIANWLLGPPPTATSPASWGSVKARHVGQ